MHNLNYLNVLSLPRIRNKLRVCKFNLNFVSMWWIAIIVAENYDLFLQQNLIKAPL